MNKGSFNTPAITLVMVAFAVLILSTSDLSQTQRRPLKGGVSQNERQGDVFNSNSRRSRPCDPNDCPCNAAEAAAFHEKDCADQLADFDKKIEKRQEEIRQINAYPQMRKTKIDPAKDPSILQYRYYKAQYQKYCECSKKYLEKMCSLTREELYWLQSECSETGGKPYGPYPKEVDIPNAERRDGAREGDNIHYDLSLGVVCWVNARGVRFILPTDALWALGSWPNRVAIGLVATANDEPPSEINDPDKFMRSKDYRAMLWCKLSVDIDGRTDKVVGVQMYSPVIYAGWTPPPDPNKVAMGFIMPFPNDPEYHKAESSPISRIYVQKRHPNSALGPIQTDEQLLVDGLIKFRAGKHTDDIGISKDVGSPYHVPWAWSEVALTYASGEFHMYMKGAVFPTHTFYLKELSIRQLDQDLVRLGDKEIALTTGAPSSMPQPNDPPQMTGQVFTHKYTLPAIKYSPGKVSGILPPTPSRTSRPWPRGVRQ